MKTGDILYNPNTNEIIEVNMILPILTVCGVTMKLLFYYDNIDKILLRSGTQYYPIGSSVGVMLNSKGKLDNFCKIGEL